MKTFKIEIIETLSKIIEIKSNSEDDAFEKVKEMYHDEEIILDNSDYVDTDFIKVDNS